jgi:hypothetical protein
LAVAQQVAAIAVKRAPRPLPPALQHGRPRAGDR